MIPSDGRDGEAVIQLGELVMILDLHRQWLSVSAIARRVGIDRKTVRKYIERGLEPPTYGARAGRERGMLITSSAELYAVNRDVGSLAARISSRSSWVQIAS